MGKEKIRKAGKIISMLLVFMAVSILSGNVSKEALAKESTVYQSGIYCYHISDEKKKEVTLIGIDAQEEVQELIIPGTAFINGEEYRVAKANINYQYYTNDTYAGVYQRIEKLIISEDFTGNLHNLIYPFGKVRRVEFKGKIPPEAAYFELTNASEDPDILFIVPKGAEEAYAGVIQEVMQYSTMSDLYEHSITMKPTITSDPAAQIEVGCFQKDHYIFQVTDSAKDGSGTVQLIGLKKPLENSYLSLPETVINDGYTYQLTKLCSSSLVFSGARVIVVPDTVTEMETAVFDKYVELLFLSKNLRTIPKYLITDENGESMLRFVYVPEGVTTISDYAFKASGANKASIILPNTIKDLGKKSLYLFKNVTFLNKKPISNFKAAIATGTTVKVASASVKSYQSKLGGKVSVITAKQVIKASRLSTSNSRLTLKLKKSVTEKASLSKASNETIFWLSSDQSIAEVTGKGVITAKGTGTAYIIAYTRTSGLRKIIRVTVTR